MNTHRGWYVTIGDRRSILTYLELKFFFLAFLQAVDKLLRGFLEGRVLENWFRLWALNGDLGGRHHDEIVCVIHAKESLIIEKIKRRTHAILNKIIDFPYFGSLETYKCNG